MYIAIPPKMDFVMFGALKAVIRLPKKKSVPLDLI